MLALKRIKKELEIIKNEKLDNISVDIINENDLFKRQVTMKGPEDSPYKDQIFNLGIVFPDDYPFSPPKCTFITKIIHVNPGQKLSVQSHNYRSEHWVVLTGTAKVVLEGKDNILSPGHSIDIAVKEIHSLQNPFDEHLEIIEVQKGDILEEDDIIRYEDMYGRC